MYDFIKKIFKTALWLVILGGLVYTFRVPLTSLKHQVENYAYPCGQPIRYSIGTVDKRFGISVEDFKKLINQSAQIWSGSINKELFVVADSGGMTINLIYDARQDTTLQLQKLGITIRSDQKAYDALRVKYNSLESSYSKQKAGLQSQVTAHENDARAYEVEVEYWNSRGGAPEAEYAKLEQRRVALNAQVAAINQAQNSLNALVDQVNEAASVLNKLARQLNLTANTYNGIGAKEGTEFEEGQYKSDSTGQEINIYQYDDKDKLIRVLAHELGHALGLEHVQDKNAIMYRVNQGKEIKLTPDDIAALKIVCKIP